MRQSVSKVFQDAKLMMHNIVKPVMIMSGFVIMQALSIWRTVVSLFTDKS